ncbi:MAG: hypothetical protein AABW79_04925 [Nanoarchaeota archaeon]
MESFINKIFQQEIDEIVHLQFQKFSRGIFKGKAMIKAKDSSKGFSFSTTSEYANDLVRALAEKLGSSKAEISGVVVSTANLEGKIPSTGKKQFMGIKQYVISGQMSGAEIIGLLNGFPDAFFALSFSSSDVVLKIKAKAPKSAKPSTSEKGPKIDFCSVKTTDKEFVKKFIFEELNFKDFEARHTYVIEEIILPVKYSSPEELRKLAKRKGKLVRETTIDGVSHKKEIEFVA